MRNFGIKNASNSEAPISTPLHRCRPLVFLAGFLFTFSAWGKSIPRERYNFPLKNSLIASIASVVTPVDESFERLFIEIRPDRRNIPLLDGRNKIPIGLFAQTGPAPLAFVVAGTGGSALSGTSLFLAGLLKHMGYHVVTLPNPMNWRYVLGVSETAAPGFLPNDAKEYYEFMGKVAAYLRDTQGLPITSYSLVGYSYGGLMSGFLAKEDGINHKFDFQKIVILNPAVDVNYAVETLDGYHKAGMEMSEIRRDIMLASVMDVGLAISAHGFNTELINRAIAKIGVTITDLEWVIAYSFRQSLGDMVFASQQVKDLGILKKHASRSYMSARLAEAGEVSFADYMQKLVVPNLKSSLDTKELLSQTSLYALADLIRDNKRIFIMENEDDFIVRQQDVEFLKSVAGDRLYLYPYGGHCGNYWFPQNVTDLQEIMAL